MYITSLQIVMMLIKIMITVIIKLKTCARGVHYVSANSNDDTHKDNGNCTTQT